MESRRGYHFESRRSRGTKRRLGSTDDKNPRKTARGHTARCHPRWGQIGFEYQVMSFQFLSVRSKEKQVRRSARDDNRSNFSRVMGTRRRRSVRHLATHGHFCLLRLYLYEALSSCHFQASWISNRRKSGSAAKNGVPPVRLVSSIVIMSSAVNECSERLCV